MDIGQLVRNASAVLASAKEVGDSYIALKRYKIYIPESYMNTPLASIEDGVTRIVGIYGIVVGDKWYGVSKACATVTIEPSETNTVICGGEPYIEFVFEPGDVIIKNLDLIRASTLVYRIYGEFYTSGNIPWYFDDSDICTLFDTSILHGDVNLRVHPSVLALLASVLARDKKNIANYYRHDKKNLPDGKSRPVYIGLRNAAYQRTNTTSRMLGNFYQDGVMSSLVNPSDTNVVIEDLLRG